MKNTINIGVSTITEGGNLVAVGVVGPRGSEYGATVQGTWATPKLFTKHADQWADLMERAKPLEEVAWDLHKWLDAWQARIVAVSTYQDWSILTRTLRDVVGKNILGRVYIDPVSWNAALQGDKGLQKPLRDKGKSVYYPVAIAAERLDVLSGRAKPVMEAPPVREQVRAPGRPRPILERLGIANRFADPGPIRGQWVMQADGPHFQVEPAQAVVVEQAPMPAGLEWLDNAEPDEPEEERGF